MKPVMHKRDDGTCIVDIMRDDQPALVTCCCERVWPEGATFNIYTGGKACFLCCKGLCPRLRDRPYYIAGLRNVL